MLRHQPGGELLVAGDQGVKDRLVLLGGFDQGTTFRQRLEAVLPTGRANSPQRPSGDSFSRSFEQGRYGSAGRHRDIQRCLPFGATDHIGRDLGELVLAGRDLVFKEAKRAMEGISTRRRRS